MLFNILQAVNKELFFANFYAKLSACFGTSVDARAIGRNIFVKLPPNLTAYCG
ncbi:hypothetical protein MHA_0188 [Mannheimia haemolytica PHL213]|nr:hypothetical protein MHH_c27430 [Mannheimia haemolytica M42548]EDN73177.1 hypothetical protein MHA_0188 [Mannheimia haemolytica PHL213]EEY09145.1 hypothetical protein COI_2341 [Mannheimia haemolytica serotype A2 str. OVINE]EEY12174.1 hypothetical protein COK_1761 [Mannheimia haemolytica serotype A2 str. BOVINE]